MQIKKQPQQQQQHNNNMNFFSLTIMEVSEKKHTRKERKREQNKDHQSRRKTGLQSEITTTQRIWPLILATSI